MRGLLLALALVAAPAPASAEAAPVRVAPANVVSMNLCTDQLAMLVAAPGQLRALSRISRDPASSAMAAEARRLPVHGGHAEEIYALAPDLVLAGAFDPPETLSLLRRLGLRVEVFPLEASFEDIRTNLTRMGTLLGRPERAAALIAAMDASLAVPLPTGPRTRAALYYASGYTSGAGTLAHEILTAAGLGNIAASRGYTGLTRLPLELLVIEAPDLLVLGQAYSAPALAQDALRHPATAALAKNRAEVADTLWSCGTPLAAGAVDALRAARQTLLRP